MQKIVTVRASQKGLSDELEEYTSQGWRIISTTKGSEWTRIFNTYKWTVVLEKPEIKKPIPSRPSVVEEIAKAKSLLDSGAITKEEFERIKADLLK